MGLPTMLCFRNFAMIRTSTYSYSSNASGSDKKIKWISYLSHLFINLTALESGQKIQFLPRTLSIASCG